MFTRVWCESLKRVFGLEYEVANGENIGKMVPSPKGNLSDYFFFKIFK